MGSCCSSSESIVEDLGDPHHPYPKHQRVSSPHYPMSQTDFMSVDLKASPDSQPQQLGKLVE
ncbi:hypothetical protein E2C01_010434 [Portunus trituberculatus]|uniref:Uncharacterized protein n=1 Tax=Portunus trituberculatus TaxID=210409 RepID=A0A5B7D8F1_PORTR|nr:hypothetical protein [Portunus trituberculatus]